MTFDHCSKAAPECENLRSMIQINLNHGEVISGAESKCLVICPLNISIKIVKIFFERVCKSSALADWKEEKYSLIGCVKALPWLVVKEE